MKLAYSLLLISLPFSVACSSLESDVAKLDEDILSRISASPIRRPVRPQGMDITPRIPLKPEAPRMAGDELVSLELRGSSLAEAVHVIAELANVNIYFDAGLDKPVDASFPSVTLDNALQTLLSRNGMRLMEEPKGVYFIRSLRGTEPARRVFALRSVSAEDIEEQLVALAGDGGSVIVDRQQNVVLVDGTQGVVDAVAEYLQAVDRLKPQVLIEVTILEALLDERFDLGLSANFSDNWNEGTYDILTSLASPGDAFSFTIQDGDGDPRGAMNTLRRYIGLELLSAPRVIAVTNTEASVEVLEEVPYVEATSTTSTGDGLGSNVVEQVVFKESGVKLKATPTIQDQGVLQIEIDLELSEVVDFFNNVPIVDSRRIANTFLVGDNETIVLGGLMQDRRRDIDEGVPILMDIPLLGRLFRRDEDTSERRELLVFVTPRILNPHEASVMADHYQDHYREVRGQLGEAVNSEVITSKED
ncbi:MAG: type II secretory pathway component GspD/PulD (secretin) [Planctomycetota bacterium]|jgi:type II secretory pathway component GspD/PulD (secretin)